ncbi:TonB-dependent receptor [Pontibacter sp. Tf4]|uniref:TonB-dependent receptor n=1 Tax=Pontibacter sp. Tf4 TaxID=2761620 RepID=UPI0016285064|nr:carboxypeptidase-like regulatory domain-containing protein [Pontibacter sp. Tf4]MBB6612244.1 TonB-dependent receptor [Pontibacter sp. Tf4]
MKQHVYNLVVLVFLCLPVARVYAAYSCCSWQQKSIKVSGTIRDARTGEAIAGATVFAIRNKTGTTTDTNGNYSLQLPAGTSTLLVSFLGYEKDSITFTSQSDIELNVPLRRGDLLLDEVKVVAGRDKHDNVRSVMSGISSLDINTIKTTPALLGEADVVRSVKLLPGVSSVGEAATGFNVRGGSTDQNLVLLDDVPIFNTSHLFGFFSVFNPDVLEGITLYRGNVPAQLGGRISSVLDVRQREGNRSDFMLSGGVGIIAARLTAEGPIIPDKSSFIVAGRSSYSDWILKKIPDADIRNSRASFYDVTAKIGYTLNEKNRLTLTGYRSKDRFGFSGDTIYTWHTNAATIKYTHLFSSDFYATITGTFTNYKFIVSADEAVNASEYSNGIALGNLKTDFYLTKGKHQVNFGASAINYRFSPGELQPATSQSEVQPVVLPDDRTLESAVYWNDEVRFTDWLTVMYGLRYSFYTVYGPADVYKYQTGEPKKERTITDTVNYSRGDVIETYHGAEPRVSANVRLGQHSAVKVGYNRSRQYLHLISNTTTVSPTDIWKTSNTYIKPQIGDQVSVGYFRNFRKNQFETGIEGYYKRIENMPDYKNGAVLYLNRTLEADLLAGKGRAYGVETSISKTSGRLTGFVNYTYSRTELSVAGPTEEETINNGDYYPASYDKPHTLNLVSSYELNKRLVASLNFTYSTGRPITAPVSHYVIGDYIVPNYGARNAYRIPDYHRLDISLAILPNKDRNRRWTGTWNIAVYNLYGRKNPYSVFFKQVYGAPPRAYQLAVVGVPLPSISYDFTFR